MKPLLELKRIFLFAITTLICGPSFARFLYWSRSAELLDADEVWKRFTQPSNSISEWFLSHYPPGFMRQFFCELNVRRIDRIAEISKHYDLSNEFYQLFLDANLFYSCADFLTDADTLEVAQEHKVNYLLHLIEPQPGEKILDLGCGWGGMLKKIYAKTGDRENLLGYTLSAQQKQFIDTHLNVKVELKDFITTEYEHESYDKIYSIGALEHVPTAERSRLSKKLARAIKPTGRIVHHFFCQIEAFPPARLLFAGTEIFPGAQLSSLKQHLNSFEQADLKVVHHSIHDYRPTLRAWFERLVANREAVIQLVGIQVYNQYLCYFAEAWRLFNDRDLMLMRFVLQPQKAPQSVSTTGALNQPLQSQSVSS